MKRLRFRKHTNFCSSFRRRSVNSLALMTASFTLLELNSFELLCEACSVDAAADTEDVAS